MTEFNNHQVRLRKGLSAVSNPRHRACLIAPDSLPSTMNRQSSLAGPAIVSSQTPLFAPPLVWTWLARTLLCTVALLTVSALGTGGLNADEPPPEERLIDVKDPVKLDGVELKIHGGTADSEPKREITLDDLKFPENASITWNPRKALENASLKCEITGKTLSVGGDRDSQVRVEYNNEPITDKTPGQLSVVVNNPDSIPPGIYRGKLVIPFEGERGNFPYRFQGELPVSIISPGRLLVREKGVQFHHAARRSGQSSGTLNVGQQADVAVQIHTIGCDTGAGNLNVKFTPTDGQPVSILSLRVPFEGIKDPIVHIPNRQSVCPQWRDAPLYVEDKLLEDLSIAADHEVHQILCHLGDCYSPGDRLQADISWDQALEATGGAPRHLDESAFVQVLGGIRMPSIGFINQRVNVEVVCQTNLGPSPVLSLIPPKGNAVPMPLTQVATDEMLVPGFAYRYAAAFKPDQLDTWLVKWPAELAAQAGQDANNAQIEIWGEMENFLEYDSANQVLWPLRVFASRDPWFWDTLRENEDEGRGYHQFRLNAFTIGFDKQFVGDVEFRPMSLYHRPTGTSGHSDRDKLEAWNPDEQPLLLVTPKALSADGEIPIGCLGRLDAWKGGKRGEMAAEDREPIRIPEGESQAFHIYCAAISDDPAHPGAEHPRTVLGTRQFVYRGLLTGTGPNGEEIARVIEIPFAVEVMDCWAFDRPKLIGGIVVVVVLIVLFVLKRRADYEPRPSVTATAGGGGVDIPELFGGSSATSSAVASPAEPEPRSGADNGPADTVSDPEPRTDSPPPRPDRPPPDPDIMGDFMS